MKTISLLKFPLVAPFSVTSVNSASVSKSAREELHRHAGSTLSPAVELRVDSAHLARARKSSAQNGNTEVLGESGLFLVTADGYQRPVDLAIQCKSTGPILVTTYDEWISQD